MNKLHLLICICCWIYFEKFCFIHSFYLETVMINNFIVIYWYFFINAEKLTHHQICLRWINRYKNDRKNIFNWFWLVYSVYLHTPYPNKLCPIYLVKLYIIFFVYIYLHFNWFFYYFYSHCIRFRFENTFRLNSFKWICFILNLVVFVCILLNREPYLFMYMYWCNDLKGTLKFILFCQY